MAAIRQTGERVVGGAMTQLCGFVTRRGHVVGGQPEEAVAVHRGISPCGDGGAELHPFAEGIGVIDVAVPGAVGEAGDEVPWGVIEHCQQHRVARASRTE